MARVRGPSTLFWWIDGLRKRIDDESYKVRFTPRKPQSHWSNVNIGRIKELNKDGLVTKAGLDAYKRRNAKRTAKASYEQKKVVLSKEYQNQLKTNQAAWDYFTNTLSPSYRKQTTWWVMSAKKEETRQRRLKILIDSSEKGELVPVLRWTKK